jgi:NADH-quinone oxidoreductase subunit A
MPLVILIVLATALAFLVIIIGYTFGPRRPSSRKAIPYESGVQTYGTGMRRMNIRYYLMAVLFILFDIEVVFLLPWAVALRKLGLFGLIEMFVFAGILLIGYIYAWKKGALEWE